MKKKSIVKAAVVTLVVVLIGSSFTAALMDHNDIEEKVILRTRDNQSAPLPLGGSTFWEDNFDDGSKIDQSPPGIGRSENYTVADGMVTIVNTCSAWTDPAWSRMKPVTLTNNMGHPLLEYRLLLSVAFESEMQLDFDDLRFKHEDNPSTWLDYWIEYYDAVEAKVWVRIPLVPDEDSVLYLFYGNPSAPGASNFDSVFLWDSEWGSDEQITNHANNEGTWDPDVGYGSGEFLIAWEEGQAYYPPYTWGFKQEIRASVYDLDGNALVTDDLVFKDGTLYFRNENPSMAFGGDTFFVAWEHYDTVANPSASTMDIKARTVRRSGSGFQLGTVRNVCTVSNTQADPLVVFDSVNNRFCVIWEDARDGTNDYDLWARRYNTLGNPVGSEVRLCNDVNSQVEPWAAFDPINEQYLVVWEHGVTANNGPFSIKAGFFDTNLNQVGGTMTLATGSTHTDYNFPCVAFCEETEQYLVTWNDGDISDGDWWGNIWGVILDTMGNTVVDTFLITGGDYVRTDIACYLSGSYLVSYDDGHAGGQKKIWGSLVSPVGEVLTPPVQLSVSSSAEADWANIAVGGGKVLVAWEDTRIDYPVQYDFYPDVFANMWNLEVPEGSEVSYAVGDEQILVLSAYVTSIAIEPEDITSWDEFNAVFTGDITFNILDGDTGVLLLADVTSGQNIQGIGVPSIRLMANFSRPDPSDSPSLDWWKVSWIPNHPPYPPSDPSPENESTGVNVSTNLGWTGGDPDPGDTVTYDIYFGTVTPPPQIAWNHTDTSYDLGMLGYETLYYWQIVSWDSHSESTKGPIWHFTTEEEPNHPPYPPCDPDPENHAIDVDIDADLGWTGGDPDPGDTVTYDIYFGTVSPPPQVAWNHTETTYDPGTMSYLRTYYWQIVSWDDRGASTPGSVWEFTTVYVPNNPPYEPCNPDPENQSTDIDIDADLGWTGGDPDPGDTVTYDIYFGTITPPPLIEYNYSETTYDPGTMEYSTLYYWQIVSWDDRGASTPGPVWEFTTGEEVNFPPFPPSDPDPPNYAEDVDINADLSWMGGDPDPGDTVTYDVYFGTSTPPPIVSENQTETTYDPGIMDYNTTHYWQIIAWDNHNVSTEGSIWRFTTTGETNFPPEKPTLSGPADGMAGEDYKFTFVTTDPNADNVSYFVDWGDGNTSGWLGPYPSGEQASELYNWTSQGTYEVTVKAKDEHDAESPWSDPSMINITAFDLKLALIIGIIKNVSTSGEHIRFNADILLYINSDPFGINILGNNERIVASQDYLGGIIKGNTSIVVGIFEASILDNQTYQERPLRRFIRGLFSNSEHNLRVPRFRPHLFSFFFSRLLREQQI